ncbi:MAG: hypothetical protein KGD67_07265 [Candidatus Lokiarchaeota archaeon]|nr:hypothetical protein [Candidatus Lokiarchaeota archaeon]
MIIKCKECGIEFTYGCKICHVCGDNTLFFGAIFNDNRSEHKWNCNSGPECIEILTEKPELRESIIEVFPGN